MGNCCLSGCCKHPETSSFRAQSTTSACLEEDWQSTDDGLVSKAHSLHFLHSSQFCSHFVGTSTPNTDNEEKMKSSYCFSCRFVNASSVIIVGRTRLCSPSKSIFCSELRASIYHEQDRTWARILQRISHFTQQYEG